MKNLWFLLLVAGLVAGVALVAGNFTQTGTAPTEDPEVPARELPEDKSDPEEETGVVYRGEEGAAPSGVETLDFKADVSTSNEDYTSRFRIRKPGTETTDIRVDTTRSDGAEMTLILREGQDEGWVRDYSSDSWTHFTGLAFTQMWRTRADQYLDYKVSEWEAMEGQEFTVENEDGTSRVYDIRVNRTIPESIFSPG